MLTQKPRRRGTRHYVQPSRLIVARAIRGRISPRTSTMNTNRSRTRTVLAGLALAAIGSGTAYGIVATGADVTPTEDDQQAATAIEYGLIAAGISFNAID